MRRPIKAHHIWQPVNGSNRPVNWSNRGTTFTPSDFLVKTPVNRSNRSVYRSEPVTHVLLNLDLTSTGFHWFLIRSGKLLPEVGGLTGLVGFVNPGHCPARSQPADLASACSSSPSSHTEHTALSQDQYNGHVGTCERGSSLRRSVA